jgi:hypothetical protein
MQQRRSWQEDNIPRRTKAMNMDRRFRYAKAAFLSGITQVVAVT